jgi:hypothetical protein
MECDYRRGFGLMIGFDSLRPCDYTLHFTVTHTHTHTHTHTSVHSLRCRCLVVASNGGHSPCSVGSQTVPSLNYQLLTATTQRLSPSSALTNSSTKWLSESQSYFMSGGLLPVGLSWCRTPWGSRPEIWFVCFFANEPLQLWSLCKVSDERMGLPLMNRLHLCQVYVSYI